MSMPKPKPRVWVVIVNWNGWQHTIGCLESILVSDYEPVTVCVCDNGSTDGSVTEIQHWARHRGITQATMSEADGLSEVSTAALYIVCLASNQGYAAGVNAGIRCGVSAGAEYLLILNNDIVLESRAISFLVRFAEGQPDASVLAPKVFELHERGCWVEVDAWLWTERPWIGDAILPTGIARWLRGLMRQWRQRGAVAVPDVLYYPPGCAMMFRADALARLGGFPQVSFLYYEEYMLAEMLRGHGQQVRFVPDAVVFHRRAASTRRLADAERYGLAVKAQLCYWRQGRRVGWLPILLLRLRATGAYMWRAASDRGYRASLARSLREYWTS